MMSVGEYMKKMKLAQSGGGEILAVLMMPKT